MKQAPARRALVAAVGAATLASVVVGATSASAAPKKPHPHTPPVDLQLLALNDFHGQLEAPSGSSSTLPGFPDPDGAAGPAAAPAFGGAEYLATQFRQLEAASRADNTLTVAAGDLIGASPLLSAAYHDEPTIEALNRIGLDYASVGNHEFDEGPAELLRIQNGGCHADGCAPGLPYAGADFDYLSANAFVTATGAPLLAPYAVDEVDGVKVGFIGMTLEGTPSVVTPSGVAGLQFADEAETANRYAKELRKQGVETIVVLLHEGGSQTEAVDVDGCNGLTGAITEIVPRMSKAIDVVVTGHSHQAYNCREVDGTFVSSSSTTEGRLVTSASSVGRLVTDIDLTLDPHSGDVLTATADNVPVVRTVAKDAGMTELINRWKALVDPIAQRSVGAVTGDIKRTRTSLFGAVQGESALGNLIADAMLAATPDADIALMNPGGVRADLLAGDITYGEAFNVQPFGNYLSTVTLTDAQLQCVLEQQFAVGNTSRNVLQPSSTLAYKVDPNGVTAAADAPCTGTRVPDADVLIDGKSIATDGIDSYRVTLNNFLADGGDGFSSLLVATDRTDVVDPEDDLAALVDYLGDNRGITAPAMKRITLVG